METFYDEKPNKQQETIVTTVVNYVVPLVVLCGVVYLVSRSWKSGQEAS